MKKLFKKRTTVEQLNIQSKVKPYEHKKGIAYVIIENNMTKCFMPSGEQIPMEIEGHIISHAYENPSYQMEIKVNLFESHQEAREFYNDKDEN